MTDPTDEKPKSERSPSYPFISLRKAEERAKQFWEKHRKESARLATVAPTWRYGIKSSGLQQTVGALKQYGLIEDSGSGEERKVQLTDLGRRLVADQRDGAAEAARKEAAMRPRLFQEYKRWIAEMPSESHCLSELELDRGFNRAAAHAFLKAFFDTVSFARLRDDGTLSSTLSSVELEEEAPEQPERASVKPEQPTPPQSAIAIAEAIATPAIVPFPQRFRVEMTVDAMRVTATLIDATEVDVLIRILEANKVLLQQWQSAATQ